MRFGGLADAAGHPLSDVELRARGITPGVVLPPMPAPLATSVTALDVAVRRGERWWVRRLEERRPTVVGGLAGSPEPSLVAERTVVLPEALAARLAVLDDDERLATWFAALGLWASTVDDGEHVDLDVDLGSVDDDLADFFAQRVPLRLEVGAVTRRADLVAAALDELVVLRRRQTYARDVGIRWRSLRERSNRRAGEAASVAVVVGRAWVALDGSPVVLALGAGGAARVVHDRAVASSVVDELVERWSVALAAIVDEPDASIEGVSLLSAAERSLLDALNATATPYRDDSCVHQLFEEQVRRTPDDVALVAGDTSLTFAVLDGRANAVARRLVAEGVGPDVLVGICVERSAEMVVGLLGILKAGGAYVPLDPVYPRDRLAVMLDDSAAPVLLTRRALVERLPVGERTVLFVDDLADEEADVLDPTPPVGPANLAYTIFTSGSTGRPKGVMVQHGNVANFLTGMDAVVGTDAWRAARGHQHLLRHLRARAVLGPLAG